MKAGQPVHLWRTRVTVSTGGVTQDQTLPTMATIAGPFFGKETDGADLVARRALQGKVEVGTPVVVDPLVPDAPLPAPSGSAK